jgi:hypothetical protein
MMLIHAILGGVGIFIVLSWYFWLKHKIKVETKQKIENETLRETVKGYEKVKKINDDVDASSDNAVVDGLQEFIRDKNK